MQVTYGFDILTSRIFFKVSCESARESVRERECEREKESKRATRE